MFQKIERYEYDIKSCNISILKNIGLIDDITYNKFNNMDKHDRVVNIGYLLRDNPEYNDKLTKGIEDAVSSFKKINNLNEKDIDEIAKDAVWTYKQVQNTNINENITFVCKRSCTSVFIFRKIKFYYNSMNGELFQRGLGNRELDIYNIISKAMHLSEINNRKSLYKLLHEYKLNNASVEIIKGITNINIIDALINDMI